MDKTTFLQLEEASLFHQSGMAMTDEDVNRYMTTFLMPRLSGLSKILSDKGMKNELTLDRYGSPALNVHVGEGQEVSATFLQSDDEEIPVLLRLTGYTEGADGEIEEKELVLFYEGVADSAEGFSALLPVLARGIKVLPDNNELKENIGDLTEYSEEALIIKPRLNGLSEELMDLSFIEDMVLVDSENPYLLLVGGNIIAAVCYETVPWSDSLFLLHIRMDMPYDEAVSGLSAEEYCRNYNSSDSIITASVTRETSEFFEMEGVREYISFHVCMPEGEALLPTAAYGVLFSRLSDVAEQLYL